MPKPPKREWLTIRTDIWGGKKTYLDVKGVEVYIENYEEAREYAQKNGFKGIRINYVGSKAK